MSGFTTPADKPVVAATTAPGTPEAASTEPTEPIKVIDSRYVMKLRNVWDAKLRLHDLQNSFREAVITIRFHATAEYNSWASKLEEVLVVLGSTRKRDRVNDKELFGGRSIYECRDEFEKKVEHWEGVRRRCQALLDELDEHVSGFTEEFLRLMPMVTEEVLTASWDDPRADPWNQLPTFNHPTLLDLAREVPSVTIDRSCFEVLEEHCWGVIPRSKCPNRTRQASVRITCCAHDTSTAPYLLPDTEIFFGTADGDIVGVTYPTIGSRRSELREYSTPPVPFVKPPGSGELATVEDLAQYLGNLRKLEGEFCKANFRAVRHTPGDTETVTPSATSSSSPAPGSGLLARKPTMRSKEAFPPGVRVFKGHCYRVRSLKVLRFGPDKKLFLASTSDDKTVRITNIATGSLISVLTSSAGMFTGVASHDGLGLIITTSRDGLVSAWEPFSGDRVSVLATFPVPLCSIHIDPGTHSLIFVGTKTGHIYGLSVDDLLPAVSSFPTAGSGKNSNAKPKLPPTTNIPPKFCFLPQGALPCYPKPPAGSEPATPQPLPPAAKVARGSHKASSITVFTTIAGFLVSGDSSGLVVQWDLQNGIEVRAFPGHVDDVTAIQISADGFIITSSRDGLILIRNLTDGTLLSRLNGHFAPVVGLLIGMITPDDPRLKLGSRPNSAMEAAAMSSTAKKTSPVSKNVAPEQHPTSAATPSALTNLTPPLSVRTTPLTPTDPYHHERTFAFSALPKGASSILLSFSEDESILGWNLKYDVSRRHGGL
jgi:WD40 repeat protein